MKIHVNCLAAIAFLSTTIFLVKESCASPSACGRIVIPLHLYASKDQFAVTESSLLIEEEGTIEGNITFRNQTGRSLSRLTVIVNYTDQDGSTMFSIPYRASISNEKNEPRNIRPFSEVHLNHPIQTQQEFGLIGRNLLSISKMPTSAEVVYWDIEFSEDGSGESSQIGQHGFRTDALLLDTPGYVRLDFPHPSERVETWVKLRINEYGRVLNVQPWHEGTNGLKSEQFRALSQQLAEWHFFPAIENGYASQSELYLLVEFEPEQVPPVRHCFLEHPEKYVNKFAFVTLQPTSKSSNDWIPYYGGFPAAGKMEPNVIELGD